MTTKWKLANIQGLASPEPHEKEEEEENQKKKKKKRKRIIPCYSQQRDSRFQITFGNFEKLIA